MAKVAQALEWASGIEIKKWSFLSKLSLLSLSSAGTQITQMLFLQEILSPWLVLDHLLSIMELERMLDFLLLLACLFPQMVLMP
jgi:hypothetical protein